MTRRNSLISAVLIAAFVVVLGVVLLASRDSGADAAEPGKTSSSSSRLVRDNSHRLGSPALDGKVTLVEFLDFECESCRAAYPVVEDLRKQYAGKVTFVLRYYPIPSHKTAMNAAIAVEAAAQQGKLEPMYKKMYETQSQWGEKQVSQAPAFRGFAQQLGLDLTAYDKAVKDPATKARVELDRGDGQYLGVQGTPTFFLNGKQLNPTSLDDFRASIDDAVKN